MATASEASTRIESPTTDTARAFVAIKPLRPLGLRMLV